MYDRVDVFLEITLKILITLSLLINFAVQWIVNLWTCCFSSKIPFQLIDIMHIRMYKLMFVNKLYVLLSRTSKRQKFMPFSTFLMSVSSSVHSHTVWKTSQYKHTSLCIQNYDVARCRSTESSCLCLREWTSWTAPERQQVPGVLKERTLGECAVVANSAPRLVTAASTHWDTLSQTRPQHGACCLHGGVW